MATESQKELVEQLVNQTARGKIDWSETPQNNCFEVSFPRYSVQLRAVENPSTTATDYEIRIINEEGSIIERFTDVELDSSFGGPPLRHPYFRKLESLFETARRTAMGAEQAVNDILDQLKDLGEDEFDFW